MQTYKPSEIIEFQFITVSWTGTPKPNIILGYSLIYPPEKYDVFEIERTYNFPKGIELI